MEPIDNHKRHFLSVRRIVVNRGQTLAVERWPLTQRSRNFFLQSLARAFLMGFLLSETICTAKDKDDRGDLLSVIVVSDVTEDGRKAIHPDGKTPLYYLPRVIGYQAIGELEQGEFPPKSEYVLHEAAKALAKDGYLVATKTSAAPSIILLFQWGFLRLSRTDEGMITTDYEGKKMTGLIAGQKAADLYPKFDHEIIDASYEDRYFILIAAYDLKEYKEHKAKKLLWVTKMSVPMRKTTLENIIPSLLTEGRKFFGKDSGHPRISVAPETKKGVVESGLLKTIDLDEPAAKKSDRSP